MNNSWTDARGKKIENGQTAMILTRNGRPSRSRYNVGRIVQAAFGRSLIERPAHPQSGASSVCDWFDNTEFVVK